MSRSLPRLGLLAVVFSLGCAGPLLDPGDGGGSPIDAISVLEGGAGGSVWEPPGEPTPPQCYHGEPACTAGTDEGCYDGPAGVGVCAAGKTTCNSWGTARSECLDQVLPRPNDCMTPTAWSCDGEPLQCHTLIASESVGSTGWKVTTIDDNSLIRAYAGNAQIHIERVTDGAVVWSRSFVSGASSYWPIGRVAVDSEENVIIVGSLEEAVILADPMFDTPASFVLKLDSAGDLLWLKTLPASSDLDSLRGVAVGPGDDIWIAGTFTWELALDDQTLTSADSMGYVARLDSDGNARWAWKVGTAEVSGLWSIAVRPDGRAIVGGSDGDDQQQCNVQQAYLASLDPSGELIWERRFQVNHGTATASSLALAPDGRFYVSGRLNTEPGVSVDFGDGIARDGGAFLLEVGDNGELIWARTVADQPMGPAIGGFVGVNQAGNVVWANQDLFSLNVRTYTASGDLLWRRRVEVEPAGLQPNQLPGWGLFGFGMYPDGRIVLGGYCAGTIDFGDGPRACGAYYATLTP